MIETLNSKGGLGKSDVKNLISMVTVKDNYDNKQEIVYDVDANAIRRTYRGCESTLG